MPTDIGTQLADAVETLYASPDLADRVIRRSRSRRRRQLAAVSLVAATGIAVAVVAPIAANTSSSGVSRLVPATSGPTTAPTTSGNAVATVYGVDVTYLPPNVHPDGEETLETAASDMVPPETPGGTTVHQSFAAPGQIDDVQDITVVVQRGASANLDGLARDAKLAIKWTTVDGQRALLRQRYTNSTNSQATSTNSYSIEWVEPGNVTVSVIVNQGQHPATVAQDVANGLIVGPSTQPTDRAAAVADIRTAVLNVFTGGKPDTTMLDFLEGSQQLAPVLAELKRNNPGVAASVRVTHIGSVFFFDGQHADVDAAYGFNFNGQFGYGSGVLVIYTAGGWKVTQATFCSVVATLVISCPSK